MAETDGNILIEMLGILKKLQNADYDDGTNREALLELYRFLGMITTDQNDFMANSADMIELLKTGERSKQVEKQWLGYVANIFISFMAIQIYEGKTVLSVEELQQVLEYCTGEHLQTEIASFCLYACAQLLRESMPMVCYKLTRKAFTDFSGLAHVLGIEYEYEGKAADENITEQCPFCGAGGDDVIPFYCSPQVTKLKNNKKFPPAKLWMKCNRCRNYYTYSFPLSEVDVINGHYTQTKEIQTLSARAPLDYYNHIFNRLQELAQGKDYLEIGIGNGEMLAVAQEFGYQVDAVEICKEDCEKVSAVLQVDVKWCDIVNYETEKKYDVIVMGDVFEHVTRPLDVLKKVERMLKEDGVLWLSTPNYNSAYARMEKFSHLMWHELNHYTYVSYESLKELLGALGMKAVHYDISNRYRGSMEVFIKKM